MGLDPSGAITFGEQLAASIRRQPLAACTLKVPKHCNVYTCGDHDGRVYFIESGLIKTLVLSRDGKQCLVSLFTSGDIFGELCLVEEQRSETATAMKDSLVKQMTSAVFIARVTRDGLGQGFIKHLATRLAGQQRLITDLATMDSEYRLASTLLQLARKLGSQDPVGLRLEQRISHEELSEMVGTTRPRISEFMRRFRHLGLIETTPGSFLIIKERPLAEYLARPHLNRALAK